MDQGLLPRRYAKALYKYAVERDSQACVYGLMSNIGLAFDKLPALQKTVSNPFVDAARKEELVAEAAGGRDNDVLRDFVRLLIRNRRIDMVRDIALAYQEIYRRANNICKVSVTSAAPLVQADRDRLTNLVQQRLGAASAEMTFLVDPDLIGGFVIGIDNDRLDASVRNELQQLRQSLLA